MKNIAKESQNLVYDPESFCNFIKRAHYHRDNKVKNHKREKSLPGSGNIWTPIPTKPRSIHLRTEGNLNKSNDTILSLNKV